MLEIPVLAIGTHCARSQPTIMSERRQAPFYVMGHLNPDTDAICSAIGHAALLRATGEEHVVAARCGHLPERTEWVLDQAGVEKPLYIKDVRIKAGEIALSEVVYVKADDTFLTAYERMVASGVRSVPVIDADRNVTGVLRFLDLLQLLLPTETEGLAVRTVSVSLSKVAQTLRAEINGAPLDETDFEERDQITLVGASSEENVVRRLEAAKEQGLIKKFVVICGDRPSIQNIAVDYGVNALIVTGGCPIGLALQDRATQQGVTILQCSQDTASTATLIRCSRQVRSVLKEDFIVLERSEPISRIRKRLAAEPQELFPVVEDDSMKLVGVMSKSDMIDPPKPKLALVDHNEYAQAVQGVEEAEIVEVIDHHRLAGDLVSREPIRYLNEPVGSTCTLVARKFRHRDLEPERGIAICLLAGLVSDTLNLTSPTTTELDHQMRDWLAGIADIDPTKFTEDFFAVGSLLASGEPTKVINTDRKEFTEEGYQISISQIEELGLQYFNRRRELLEAALRELQEEKNYDLACLVVTDIGKHYSLIIACGPEAVLAALPFDRKDDTLFHAPGAVSRKKQIFPAVCHAVAKAGLKETRNSSTQGV